MSFPGNQPPPPIGPDGFPPGTPPGQGAPGRYRVGLTKVTSVIIMTSRRSAVHTGTLDQLERAARAAMIHNLLLGWWGIPFGFIWTPMALARNSSNMKKIRALAANQQA
jgi:hypothetical protein